MTAYAKIQDQLQAQPKTWLVTGVAGFIGSNILETLLRLGQRVVGLDNLCAGRKANLTEVQRLVGEAAWASFRFVEGDIRDPETCQQACRDTEVVLHLAALGSVPQSIVDPLLTNASNVSGFLNLLVAARTQGVKRFVYSSSCAVYGDDPRLPKTEAQLGRSLSPYATSKLMNELYAEVCGTCYQQQTVGLRYFNVFGPRQDPAGAYAAVIPMWIAAMIRQAPVSINGDGETSRDFIYVADVVQANMLAATTDNPAALNQAFNIGTGRRTTLNQLFAGIQEPLVKLRPEITRSRPVYRDFRAGDIRHSEADITKARTLLGFHPGFSIEHGLEQSMAWYLQANTQAARP
jgi:UDP-N-acetylglucosamine 4-epimerase